MDESEQNRWCLYVPGLCLHAVPVAPGRHERLHVQHLQAPGFKFYPIETRSTRERTPNQEEIIQHLEIRPLYPDVHPALQQPSPPSTIKRLSRVEEELLADSLYADVYPRPYPRFRTSSTRTLAPKPPAESLPRSRLPVPESLPGKQHLFQRLSIPDYTPPKMPAMHSPISTPGTSTEIGRKAQLIPLDDQAFENTSTSVAASQMRNALNQLADTVKDPEEKKVRFKAIGLRGYS